LHACLHPQTHTYIHKPTHRHTGHLDWTLSLAPPTVGLKPVISQPGYSTNKLPVNAKLDGPQNCKLFSAVKSRKLHA